MRSLTEKLIFKKKNCVDYKKKKNSEHFGKSTLSLHFSQTAKISVRIMRLCSEQLFGDFPVTEPI